MKIKRIIKSALIWLPSILVSMIFIQNGLNKMTSIVFIHIYKEKPFEVGALIVFGTILSAYMRKPGILQQERQS